MSNYTQVTFFTPKDSLPTNSPQKTIFGAAYDVEFGNISTAIASKPDNLTTASFLNVNVTGNIIPQNGWYLPATNTLGVATNSTQRGTINATGVWVINAPSSGTALTVNGVAATDIAKFILADTVASSTGLRIVNSASNNPGAVILPFASAGTLNPIVQGNDTTIVGAGSSAGAGVLDLTIWGTVSSGIRISSGAVATQGNVTLNTPASGNTLAINNLGNNSAFTTTDGTVSTNWFTAGGASGLLLGTTSNHQLQVTTNNVTRLIIAAAGNVTINSPSSGNTLTTTSVNAANAAAISAIQTGTTSLAALFSSTGNTTAGNLQINFDNAGDAFIYNTIATTFFLGGTAAGALTFVTNNAQRVSIDSNGVVTANAPSSSGTHTFNGPANNYALTLVNNGAAGTSLGLLINAGTNSSDAPLAVLNKGGGTIFFEVFGNGESFVAPPTAATDRSSTPIFQVGYLDIPQNVQSVSYATVMTDRGKAIQHNSASAHTFTINDATVNYPVGTVIMIINPLTNGTLTIALQTTANNLVWSPSGAQGNRTLAAAGQATVMKYAAGTPGVWQIAGTGLS